MLLEAVVASDLERKWFVRVAHVAFIDLQAVTHAKDTRTQLLATEFAEQNIC